MDFLIESITPAGGLRVEIIDVAKAHSLMTPTLRSTFPLVCGLKGLQTRGATPRDAIKSAKSGFHLGTSSSISRKTLFMRSVSAALGNPPKYSNAAIIQRIMVGVSQRFTKVTKRMRE